MSTVITVRTGYGVQVSGGTAVFATGGVGGYSVYANGAAVFNGYIYKFGGGFLIDHPLDPANKLLEHSFVESAERKNLYDGIATTDASGEARIDLPDYFEALNEDFRYQLTAIGAPAPSLHVKQAVSKGHFIIAGATAGQQISWQISGNRKDVVAKANPVVAERQKSPEDAGFYLHPEAFGAADDKRIKHLNPASLQPSTK